MRCLVTIIPRKFEESCMAFFRENGVHTMFSTLCHGTAQKKTLDFMGLEDTDKVMLFAVTSTVLAPRLLSGLIRNNIDAPGNGIALSIPIDSIGGSAALEYLTHGQQTIVSEVQRMEQAQFSLIMVIAESGCVDMVMDAARSADARGGTVVHAKGTGSDLASKFFGVSLAAEKEMIYIVAKHSKRDAIMRAIMEKAGPDSEARAAIFTLPVDSVAGLRSVTQDEE